MKIAIKYYKGCHILDKADEIIIKYTHKTSQLIDFVQKWENKRIIVDISELNDIEDNVSIFKEAFDAHNEIAIMALYGQKIEKITAMHIPFFFADGVKTIDDFIAQVNLGVSDIYLLNELCFDIVKYAKICREKGIKIRVYPNVAQTQTKFDIDSFKQFFIRPDDVDIYEDYIDIFEFFGPLDRQPVLYKIYTDKEWLGDLKDIIIGLKIKVDNKTIIPYFARARLDCQKNCAFNKCTVCDAIASLAATLKDQSLGINKDEYKANETTVQNESAAVVDDNV